MEVSLKIIVRLLFCVLVCGVHSTAAEVFIAHNGNFDSDLMLRCTDRDGFNLPSGVSFHRNGTEIRGDGIGMFSYSLNQGNEGNFTCTRGSDTSRPITLAAVPPLDFPEHDSEHVLVQASGTVTTLFNCDIRPGAAPENYNITWFRLNSDGSFTRIRENINRETFSLTLQVNLSHNNTVYHCTVRIDHDGVGTGNPIPYDGAEITLYTAVRASITESVQNKTVTIGEQANFSCSAVGSEVDIQWKLNDTVYGNCPAEGPTDICFKNSYMNDTVTTRSTLIIADSSSLGLGSHMVQCIVEQDLDSDFGAEPFQESTASLHIQEELPSSSPSPTRSPSPTPATLPGDEGGGLNMTVIAIVVATLVVVLTVVLIISVILVLRVCRRRNDPESKWTRCFSWNVKKNEPIPLHNFNSPPHVHVDVTDRFHSGDTPELRRQNGVNGSQHQQSQDALEPIYNYSQASAASGLSALSDSDMSISNPPSPAVSSINLKDDDVSPGSDELQEPSPPAIFFSSHQPPYPHSQSSASASNFGITNLFGYDGTSDYDGYPYDIRPESSHHHSQHNHHPSYESDPQFSLNVPPRPRKSSLSSDHTQHSDHSHHSGKTHTTHHSNHSNRSNRSSRSGRSDHSRHSKGSHTHLDDDEGSHYSGSHYSGSHYSGSHVHRGAGVGYDHTPRHHSQSPRPRHGSKSRSRSPKSTAVLAPTYPLHAEPPSRYSPHYHSHDVLRSDYVYPPEKIPMRSSRSDEHVKRVAPSHVPPPHHPPHLPPHPPHPATRHLAPPQPAAEYASDEPDEGDGGEVIDEVLLTAVGCLMHQENCRIPRCPCRQVKERFRHLLPQTRSYMQKEAGKVMEESSRGEFDPTDRRQQMRLSLTSRNISEEIHPHYHMTSHSHIRQSRGMRRVLQRKRSRSVDLTPVVEQPESNATTPAVFPEAAKGLIPSRLFSPAITPSGEQFRVLSPTTPGVTQPPVLLREISLSADNLPSLCLNDCPMAYTPLYQLGNRALGSGAKSQLASIQRRWSASMADKPKNMPTLREQESASSEEGNTSERFTSQESSSSIQTNSTHSSGQSAKSEENSVFSSYDGPGRHYNAQTSSSTTSTDPDESLKRRKKFEHSGRQNELTREPTSFTPPLNTLDSLNESGYGTVGDHTDTETGSLRSRHPPCDLPISPKIPAKTKSQSMPREAANLLMPSNAPIRRTGSTSSHGSHTSCHSAASHTSVASNGSVVTETLC